MNEPSHQHSDTPLAVAEPGGQPHPLPEQRSAKELGESLCLADSSDGSSLRWRLRTLATAAVRPMMLRKSRHWLANGQPHRLHLGCGRTILPGWLNVDLVGRQAVDLALDLRKPFPFPDRSIDAVFHEHLIEHLTYQDAVALLSECARVLRPGGVLRVSVPDFRRYLYSYVHGTDFIETVRPGRFSPLIALSEVAYCYGHRSLWDAQTLSKVLETLGLTPAETSFGQSRLEPCPDQASRANETLYVEAIKPS